MYLLRYLDNYIIMPTPSLKEFEYERALLMPEDKVNTINAKLNRLQQLKSEGKDTRLTDYYVEELTKMKEDAYKYPVYSHLGVYLPEYGVLI